MSDNVCMICYRVADNPTPGHASTRHACQSCGEDVWISPGSLATALRLNALIACLQCGVEIMKQDEKPELLPLSPEQRVEMINDRHVRE